jgi:hypothetical protein
VEDMCCERRRTEACVDESAHHALGPVRNQVLYHRVRLFSLVPLRNQVLYHRLRLFSLVPLVWESNPKLHLFMLGHECPAAVSP